MQYAYVFVVVMSSLMAFGAGAATRTATGITSSSHNATEQKNISRSNVIDTISRDISDQKIISRPTPETKSRNATEQKTVSRAAAIPVETASRNATEQKTISRTAAIPVETASRNATEQKTTSRTAAGIVSRTAPAQQNQLHTSTERVAARAATTPTTDRKAILELWQEKSSLQETCQTQYNACMDNFCDKLDDSRGRCMCSANLSKYEKTETALKQTTEQLQEVAQKIQYIGLTANEIETLFTQTEAEQQMQNLTDSSQIKSDLDRVKKLILTVKTPSSASSDAGDNLDLSGLLDFSSDPDDILDISSLFGTSNTSSINNQRGEQLRKTAAARCKASVLNDCAAQGIESSLIANVYDIEIDKACIKYERDLTTQNDNMKSTIRSAQTILQKARLTVAQNKNQYDLRGCINAMDSCVQDDFVCGSDYDNCLDPTGKYIVNGDIVSGSQIGSVTFSDDTLSEMLRKKIGYIDDHGTAIGLCAGVMLKCQKYTMPNGKYEANNEMLSEYLSRVTPLINKRRKDIIDEYRQTCLGDVQSCLAENQAYGTNACTAVATTCKSAMGDPNTNSVKQWLESLDLIPLTCTAGQYVLNNKCEVCPVGHYCPDGMNATLCPIGKYSDTTESTACEQCTNAPSHAHYTTDGNPNSDCDWACDGNLIPGTNASGDTICGCDAGKYISNNECTDCPSGYLCENGVKKTCPDGFLCKNGVKTPCPLGNTCSGNKQTPCPSGTSCINGIKKQCTPGYYCPDGVEEAPCPNGEYSDEGARSRTDCKPCKVTYSTEENVKYLGPGASATTCQWECKDGFHKYKVPADPPYECVPDDSNL